LNCRTIQIILRQILNLLFKNIKITHTLKGTRKKIFSFSFFAPFSALFSECLGGSASGGNFFYPTGTSRPSGATFFEKEQKSLCQKNQRLTTKGSPERSRGMKNLHRESSSGLSDARWTQYYTTIVNYLNYIS
jgi:hypothetical protein